MALLKSFVNWLTHLNQPPVAEEVDEDLDKEAYESFQKAVSPLPE